MNSDMSSIPRKPGGVIQFRSYGWEAGLCALAMWVVAGCGGDPNVVPVYATEGIVLLDDAPFGPTRLLLVPEDQGGRSVAGEVAADGKVSFTSFKVGDGAPAGKYRVLVGQVMAPPPRPFPNVYRGQGSPLKVTVEAKEKNEIVIAMDSKAGSSNKSARANGMNAASESEGFNAGATGD